MEGRAEEANRRGRGEERGPAIFGQLAISSVHEQRGGTTSTRQRMTLRRNRPTCRKGVSGDERGGVARAKEVGFRLYGNEQRKREGFGNVDGVVARRGKRERRKGGVCEEKEYRDKEDH